MKSPRFLLGSFLLLITPLSPAHAQEPLYDVQDHPYRVAIMDLYDRQIVQGNDGDGAYKPDEKIDRASFNMILVRALLGGEENIPEGFNFSCFPDVPAHLWYTDPTCYSQAQKIIQGRPDGRFWPGDPINFAEASKIVVNTLKVPLPSAPPEGESFTHWYESYIYALSQKNAIPQTITRADQFVTRAEMAEMASRILGQITDRPSTAYETFKPAPPPTSLACIDQKLPASIDMQRVREAWLKWNNEARAAAGLHPYQYHEALHYSARVWSEYNASKGTRSMTHQRPGDTAFYSYNSIKQWFTNLGLTFGGSSTLFTENMTWGPFTCTSSDCTEAMIKGVRYGFDGFMSEKGTSYTAHYDSVMSPHYKWIGFGLVVDENTDRFYVTIHYAQEVTGQPSSFCQ